MHTSLRSRIRDRHGYTLAEILAVLMILGILTAIAAPRVSGMFATNQVKSVLDRFSSDVAFARMRAIRSGRPATVASTSTWSYAVVATRTDGAVDTVKKVNLLTDYPGLTMTTFAITFDSRGVLKSGSTQSVSASRDGQTNAVSISSVGRVYREY